MTAAPEAALTGLRVLDLSTGVAGQYCGKLLASYGADCILVEPPSGTPTRLLPPHIATTELSTRSALFRHLNQGKSSMTADLGTGGGRRAVAALAADADVIIHDQGTPLPRPLPPTAVECVIGEFAATGPHRHWHGCELVHQALSGTMYMTGHPDRQPLYGIGHRAYYACGTTACISALAALHERARSGRGQTVTATVFESAAAIGQNFVSQYSYNKTYESRQQYPGFLGLLECRDRWIVIFAIRNWEALCEIFGLQHLLHDERLTHPAARLQHWPLVVDLLQRHARQRAAGELAGELQRSRVSAEVVSSLNDLMNSAQWRARRILWATVSEGGRMEAALGPPFTIAATGYAGLRPSPALDTNRRTWPRAQEIRARWSRAALTAPAGAGGPQRPHRSEPSEHVLNGCRGAAPPGARAPGGPLARIRVIDFTTAWAGPFATRSLAYLGAHVIKIDTPSHMDAWRGAPEGGPPQRYPDGDPGARPWNRCVLFNTQGQGKWSLGLDLKVSGARDVLLRLAEVSDVVVANFTPGVLDRLGVGYESLRTVNPQIIVVEMPAFGPGGPASGHQGMGKTMEAACGMAALMGYGDGVPVLTGPAYLDPIGGLYATAATLTALHYRRRTGRGCHVEVPQTEAAVHWIGEYVLEQAQAGRSRRPDGNAAPGHAPHDAYPCRGCDEWIAIAVATEQHWRALCQVIARPDLAADQRFASASRRLRRRDVLRELLSESTQKFGKHELAKRLQNAGVPAAPVANGGDIAADQTLLATGFIQQLEHREAGTHHYPTLAYRLARTPGHVHAAAPCFGEHNTVILRDLLHLPQRQITALERSGAVTDRPRGQS